MVVANLKSKKKKKREKKPTTNNWEIFSLEKHWRRNIVTIKYLFEV